MYGTVARLQIKPGMEDRLNELAKQDTDRTVPGYVASYVYRMDAEPNVHYLVVLFESKAAYVANANDPSQDAEYRQLRETLVADPEWHDGEVVFSHMVEQQRER